MIGSALGIVMWALGLLILYWVVRAAVKGGILDADRAISTERTRSVIRRTDDRPEQPRT
ncbi:hypothetical protein PU560_03615 [Georgenia sp. 10Sc9-8]|uniref:Uncharacterized protein n=1 Tax=Georgenia halotolerans TaxID=3028317 RepID=A0ABT5TWA5_9MICO|nr:hypothetical protein [Georgenia halotolerans]